MMKHYFSCLGRPGAVFHNKRAGTHYTEHVFSHLVASTGHVVQFGASGMSNVDTLFFMLRWDRYRFPRKHAGICYTELVFLHPVGSAGHVVHSGAFGA
jgi:hypothetical protein